MQREVVVACANEYRETRPVAGPVRVRIGKGGVNVGGLVGLVVAWALQGGMALARAVRALRQGFGPAAGRADGGDGGGLDSGGDGGRGRLGGGAAGGCRAGGAVVLIALAVYAFVFVAIEVRGAIRRLRRRREAGQG